MQPKVIWNRGMLPGPEPTKPLLVLADWVKDVWAGVRSYAIFSSGVYLLERNTARAKQVKASGFDELKWECNIGRNPATLTFTWQGVSIGITDRQDGILQVSSSVPECIMAAGYDLAWYAPGSACFDIIESVNLARWLQQLDAAITCHVAKEPTLAGGRIMRSVPNPQAVDLFTPATAILNLTGQHPNSVPEGYWSYVPPAPELEWLKELWFTMWDPVSTGNIRDVRKKCYATGKLLLYCANAPSDQSGPMGVILPALTRDSSVIAQLLLEHCHTVYILDTKNEMVAITGGCND